MSYVSAHYHCVFSTKERRPRISTELREYINDQENHHRKMRFQEEFLALLKKHRVEYDERYLWG